MPIPLGKTGPSLHKRRGKDNKVLIIDDNDHLVFILRLVLEREGYRVKTAANGLHGYDSYVRFNPDVVITDIEMPEANGIEMMRQIRSHNPGIRTIYMSSSLSRFQPILQEERTKYRVGLLEKPFCKSQLLSLLAEEDTVPDRP